MSATRTAPAWKPWPMRRGNNLPQVFRWVDDGGPVAMTMPGLELHLRISMPDGTFIDKQAGVDPEFVIFDQAQPAAFGVFSFTPSLELVESLAVEPAPKYEFEARYGGLEQTIGVGQIVVRGAGGADA